MLPSYDSYTCPFHQLLLMFGEHSGIRIFGPFPVVDASSIYCLFSESYTETKILETLDCSLTLGLDTKFLHPSFTCKVLFSTLGKPPMGFLVHWEVYI